MKRLFVIIALVIVFCANAGAQIFFKVDGKDLKQPSYLFGTHHFVTESMLDSLPKVREALQQAECMVGEVVMDSNPMELMQVMQKHMMTPSDSTLSKLYAPEVYARLDSVCTKLTDGIGLILFETMKPAAAQITIASMMEAFKKPDGEQLDIYLQKVARKDSKPVKGLETGEFQAEVLFDIIPISKQAVQLAEMLNDPDETMRETLMLRDAYLQRDGKTMWNLSKQAGDVDAEFFEILLNKRNEKWMEQLPTMMSEQSLFVAVGALHLYGEQGLVESMRRLGYNVTAIY